MSRHAFDPNCPDCRPVLIDPKTMKVFPPDSPVMQAVDKVWEKCNDAEKQAFHRVTCLNSREKRDMSLVEGINRRIRVGLELVFQEQVRRMS